MKASQHLSSYNISMNDARSFVTSNVNNLSYLISVCSQFGVTNEMLAEIYGDIPRGLVVRYFAKYGINSLYLDDVDYDTEDEESDYGLDAEALTLNVETADDIEERSDSNLYSIELEAGVTYTITLASDELSTAYLVLRDANGDKLESDVQSSGEDEATLTFTADESGTYFIDVSDLRDISTGEFTLIVEGEESSYDDDYAGSTATEGSLEAGDTIIAEIEEYSDSDWFAVEVTAGDTYTFTLSTDDLETPYLVLRDADGEAVDEAFNITGEDIVLTYTATEDETFYIDASDLASDSAGSYLISLESDAEPVVDEETEEETTEDSTEDDYSSDILTTGLIDVDSTATGTIETEGDTDWFAISLVADTTYEVTMTSDELSLETVTVFDSEGLEEASATRTLTESGASLTFTASETGTYYIEASQDLDSETGAYLIGVQEVLS